MKVRGWAVTSGQWQPQEWGVQPQPEDVEDDAFAEEPLEDVPPSPVCAANVEN